MKFIIYVVCVLIVMIVLTFVSGMMSSKIKEE